MRRIIQYLSGFMLANLLTLSVFAQSITLKGTVKNSTNNEFVPKVSIQVKDSDEGVVSNDQGSFSLSTNKKPPLILIVTAVNFESKEIRVTDPGQFIEISFTPSVGLGQEVVVSATRTPLRILESPVSIERIGSKAIINSPATSYYDLLGNLKGVDMITSSLTFRTPTTRGFSGSGNARFNQIVSGMDNQAPGLNFSVGGVIGLTELDVESMELLQGASSALYGPGGMNGTLLINGKSPFRYEGLSFQVKSGLMHTDGRTRPSSGYYDWSVRYAKVINPKLAFKIGAQFLQAKDWVADDYRNYKRFGTKGQLADGTRETDPNYDGVNVYGDETSVDIKPILRLFIPSLPFDSNYINSLPNTMPVSRTGYTENEVVNPNTVNMKLSGGIFYKITNNIEVSLSGYFGTGNTVYTGSQRYSLKDLKIGQYKFEVNAKNWFLRAYTTQENAGESHNLTVATQLFNETWKPSTSWYPAFAQGFLAAKLGGATDAVAYTAGRTAADAGRPAAGSDQFKAIYDVVRKKPIPTGGLFLDRSDLYMTEGQYNLTEAVKFAEVIVGASWKQYVLNSEGTLFPDKVGEPIKIDEYGAYVQLSKGIMDNKIKFTASGRFDKNQNFAGKFTPRLGVVFKPSKDQNIRFSYQTAYRFPSTQQQWIDLNVGTGRLIGCNKFLWDKYSMTSNPVYAAETFGTSTPVVVSFIQVKPESVTSFELGYKALFAKTVLIDVYGYYGQYQNFISRRDVVQRDPLAPTKFNGFSVVVNAPGKVKTYGYGASIEYLLPRNFSVTANASSDVLDKVPTGFQSQFNTPRYRTNVSVSNSGFGCKNLFGASVSWKWQDAFDYQSDFVYGPVPAYHSVDAQINYKFTDIKTMVKLGATNLLNQYYRSGLGNATVGGMYYVSFAYNVF